MAVVDGFVVGTSLARVVPVLVYEKYRIAYGVSEREQRWRLRMYRFTLSNVEY